MRFAIGGKDKVFLLSEAEEQESWKKNGMNKACPLSIYITINENVLNCEKREEFGNTCR